MFWFFMLSVFNSVFDQTLFPRWPVFILASGIYILSEACQNLPASFRMPPGRSVPNRGCAGICRHPQVSGSGSLGLPTNERLSPDVRGKLLFPIHHLRVFLLLAFNLAALRRLSIIVLRNTRTDAVAARAMPRSMKPFVPIPPVIGRA